MKRTIVFMLLMGAAIAGCSKSNKPVPVNYYSPTGGPDPFQTQVFKPLAMPQTFAVLPTPANTGSNLADMGRKVPQSQIVQRTQRSPSVAEGDPAPLSQPKTPSKIGGFFNWMRNKLSR